MCFSVCVLRGYDTCMTGVLDIVPDQAVRFGLVMGARGGITFEDTQDCLLIFLLS